MTNDSRSSQFLYDGFISYSRRDKDFAQKLEAALERYRPPDTLDLPQRELVIFRDEADFTGADYFESVTHHLKSSAKLIVICSPHARHSKFVNEEIVEFCKVNAVDKIVPILISGVPNNEATKEHEYEMAFPESLCSALKMPLAVNFTGFSASNHRINKDPFKRQWYSLLANILDVSVADIEQKDADRQQRNKRIIIGIVVSIVLVLLCLLVVALNSRSEAIRQRELADKQKKVAMDAYFKVTYDIPKKLEQFPHSEEVRAGIITDTIKGLGQFHALLPEDLEVRRELATNHRLLGNILRETGKIKAAYSEFKQSADMYELIIKKSPDNAFWLRDFAVSMYNMGELSEQLHEKNRACNEYAVGLKSAQDAVKLDPQWAPVLEETKKRIKTLGCAS